eukprot:COSAG02_NODE_162_length_32474_cov_13.222511_8_plen_81_part_00
MLRVDVRDSRDLGAHERDGVCALEVEVLSAPIDELEDDVHRRPASSATRPGCAATVLGGALLIHRSCRCNYLNIIAYVLV